jgi:hypothetical protein
MSRRGAALAAVAAALLAVPSTAGAVKRTVDYGTPGQAQMPVVRGWWNPNGGTLRIPGRLVGRSPMSQEPQTLCAEFTFYKFTADYFQEPWAFDGSRHWCVRTTAHHRARFPTWHYRALAYQSYNLNITITWRVTDGAALSSALYDYNFVRDYRCQTKNCASAIRYGGVGSIRFES